jgi:hypothetical protein
MIVKHCCHESQSSSEPHGSKLVSCPHSSSFVAWLEDSALVTITCCMHVTKEDRTEVELYRYARGSHIYRENNKGHVTYGLMYRTPL